MSITWTDQATAIGTIGATTVALVGLGTTVWFALRERRRADVLLREERERAAQRELARVHTAMLLRVAEAWWAVHIARGRGLGTDEDRAVQGEMVRPLVLTLPDHMVTNIRRDLGYQLTPEQDAKRLAFSDGRTLTSGPGGASMAEVEYDLASLTDPTLTVADFMLKYRFAN